MLSWDDISRFYSPYDKRPELEKWVKSQYFSSSCYDGPSLRDNLPSCVHPECKKDGDGESKKYRYPILAEDNVIMADREDDVKDQNSRTESKSL